MTIEIIKDYKDERRTYKKGRKLKVQPELAERLIKEKVAKPTGEAEFKKAVESRSNKIDDNIESKIK